MTTMLIRQLINGSKQEDNDMKVLGVIGGLGPMATVYFLQLLTQMSDAQSDQEHMEILIHSKPQIPDRTRYILGQSEESPLPGMIQVGKQLTEQGAEILAIPCITAHYFHKQLEEGIGIPVINAIEETADYLKQQGITKAGIMATNGTIESGLFQQIFEENEIDAFIPSKVAQDKVMSLIYDNVKAGKAIDMDSFYRVSEELLDRGAQVILLACTELSLIKRDFPLSDGYLDVMEVLARKAVMICGKLKQEYMQLSGKQKEE